MELGFRLIVALPMLARRSLSRNFLIQWPSSTPCSRKRTRRFCSHQLKRRRRTRLPARPCAMLSSAHIARHSQILLALWDGDRALAIGGTSQVVHFKREGVDAPLGPPPARSTWSKADRCTISSRRA